MVLKGGRENDLTLILQESEGCTHDLGSILSAQIPVTASESPSTLPPFRWLSNKTHRKPESLTFLSLLPQIIYRLVHVEEIMPQRLSDAVVRYRRLDICEKWFGDTE